MMSRAILALLVILLHFLGSGCAHATPQAAPSCVKWTKYSTCVFELGDVSVDPKAIEEVQDAFVKQIPHAAGMMRFIDLYFTEGLTTCGSGTPPAFGGCHQELNNSITVAIHQKGQDACLFKTSLAHELLHAWYYWRYGNGNPLGNDPGTRKHRDPEFYDKDGIVERVNSPGRLKCSIEKR